MSAHIRKHMCTKVARMGVCMPDRLAVCICVSCGEIGTTQSDPHSLMTTPLAAHAAAVSVMYRHGLR